MKRKIEEEKMELVISILLGVWIAIGGWLGYKSVKKEYATKEEIK